MGLHQLLLLDERLWSLWIRVHLPGVHNGLCYLEACLQADLIDMLPSRGVVAGGGGGGGRFQGIFCV